MDDETIEKFVESMQRGAVAIASPATAFELNTNPKFKPFTDRYGSVRASQFLHDRTLVAVNPRSALTFSS